MRRQAGNFEIVIKSPTLGLMTRIPGDQPDPRYAHAASNVRFDDGVIRNAPGYASLVCDINPDPVNLIFQANVNPAVGGDKVGGVLICTESKVYALRNMAESVFPLTEDQIIEFRGDLRSHDDIRNLPTGQRRGRVGEVGLTENSWVIAVSIKDNLELWKFRARGTTEADDDRSFLVPNDWGVGTNNNIFVRIG